MSGRRVRILTDDEDTHVLEGMRERAQHVLAGREVAAACRDLGAEVVVNYTIEDFAATVMDATAQRGADVVFDNVGAAVMPASMNFLAYNGRYLMMGFASNKRVADEPFVVPRRIATANIHLCGVLWAYERAA